MDVEEHRRAYPFGQVVTIMLAVGVWWVASLGPGLTWGLSDWDGWPILSVIILAASVINVVAVATPTMAAGVRL